MPIYEFYCRDCNTIFSFFSRAVNTSKRPKCPRCRKRTLDRQVSRFAAVGRAGKGGEEADLPVDETRMERAMESLAAEAEGMNEDDPRQAARLMRRMGDMTGMQFGAGMEEAIHRMEAGAEGAAEGGERAADPGGMPRVLEQAGALEVAVAVEARGEQEVPLEQGLRLLQNRQHALPLDAHGPPPNARRI